MQNQKHGEQQRQAVLVADAQLRCTHQKPTGAVRPSVSQYMPGEQGTQSELKVMPLVLENVPIGHGTGADTAVGLQVRGRRQARSQQQ